MDSDVALLTRYARTGDPLAFSELAVRYRQLVFSAARRVTGNHHDAEDVTQACFLELARRAAVVRESVAGWLHHQATSRSIDLIRRVRTRERHEQAAAREDIAGDMPRWGQIGPVVDEAIEELPDDLRVPLILYFLQGMSQDEVAHTLSLSQRTVSRRIQIGLNALRKNIGPRGIAASAGLLGFLLKQNAVLATPASLNVSIAKVGLAGIGVSTFPSSTTSGSWPGHMLETFGYVSVSAKIGAALAVLLMLTCAMAWSKLGQLSVASPYQRLLDAYQPYMTQDALAFPTKVRSLTDSPEAFLRGADELVLEWAQQYSPDWFAQPDTFILSSGGVHVANLGSYPTAGRMGSLALGLRDFDHTSRLPLEVELLRGLMSLFAAADASGVHLNTLERSDVARIFLDSYRDALSGRVSGVGDDPIRLTLTYEAQRKVYAEELATYVGTDGRFRRIVGRPNDVKDILRPAVHDRAEIAAALADATTHSPSLASRVRFRTAAEFETATIDLVVRTDFASSSNQGLAKYLVLLQRPFIGEEHDGILYLKQQIPTPAERQGLLPVDQRTPGHRVAESTLALSEPDPYLIGWCDFGGRSFSIHLREPWSRSIDPSSLGTLDRLISTSKLLGEAAGRMHRASSGPDTLTARITPEFQTRLLNDAVACLSHLTDLQAALKQDPRAVRDNLAVESALKSWTSSMDSAGVAQRY